MQSEAICSGRTLGDTCTHRNWFGESRRSIPQPRPEFASGPKQQGADGRVVVLAKIQHSGIGPGEPDQIRQHFEPERNPFLVKGVREKPHKPQRAAWSHIEVKSDYRFVGVVQILVP